jgi:23S rRNA (adenine2503-C2)-methyltransferase
MGLKRNLEAWEIVDQLIHVRSGLPSKSRVHGVVFQGMGEPLMNAENVITAIRMMMEPSALGIACRNVTVCTSGYAPGLRPVMEALPNVRFGLSIGSAVTETRKRLIPLEKKFPIETICDVLADQTRLTRIAPMWAYTLLEGVNDTEADLAALGILIERFSSRAKQPPRISLIPYNPIGENDPFRPASAGAMEEFRKKSSTLGAPVIRRYSGGADIAAACGQLGMKLTGL